MKLIPLYDLQQEINRLFIAGSKFAKDDPRLQKQVAVFDKLGEKSPVFKKIAEGIESLINVESVDSSAKLLEISTLLYSILYTQGETVDAEQPETELTPVLSLNDVHTNKSYLALKPLVEALTLQKDGRINTVKKAFENGQCDDFRIYPMLNAALADRNYGLADYIETVVIPAIGKHIIPFIVNGFHYEGKMEDVRRFRILCKLGFSDISKMANEILACKSSVLLQAEAVKALGAESVKALGDSGNEDLLIKFTDDKQKSIRLAAYETLASLNTNTAQHILVDLFISGKKKQDASELSEVLKIIKLSDQFIPGLLEKAKADFRRCLELDKAANWKAIYDALESLMISMNPLINNINEDILEFYREVFTNKKYHELSKIVELRASQFYPHKRIMESIVKSLENIVKE
jgi:hypothetical protein